MKLLGNLRTLYFRKKKSNKFEHRTSAMFYKVITAVQNFGRKNNGYLRIVEFFYLWGHSISTFLKFSLLIQSLLNYSSNHLFTQSITGVYFSPSWKHGVE